MCLADLSFTDGQDPLGCHTACREPTLFLEENNYLYATALGQQDPSCSICVADSVSVRSVSRPCDRSAARLTCQEQLVARS